MSQRAAPSHHVGALRTATSESRSVAFIHTGTLGWGSVSERYKRYQGQLGLDLVPYAVEGFEPQLGHLWRLGVTPWVIASAVAGRRAYRQAVRDGHRRFLFVTQSHALMLPRSSRFPVATYGDATWHQIGGMASYQVRYDWGTRLLEKRGMRDLRLRRALMLCMSTWYKRDLAETYGFRHGSCVHLPLMADPDYWVPKPRESDSRFRVVFVGGDFRRKGGDILLEASRVLGKDAEFVFVTHSREPIPDGYEVHTGLKPDSIELRNVMQSCDLLALPTRGDCNSHVSVEAALCGLPAVVSSVGALPEIVIDGQTGTVLDSWDAEQWAATIRGYANDRARLAEFGRRARERASEYHGIGTHLTRLQRALVEQWKGFDLC